MEEQLIQIREAQKRSWNRFSPGWKKWDGFNMDFLHPMGDAIINNLKIKDGEHVLDVATGTGEPGITIARMMPGAKVTGTDLAENMLAVAEENAKAAKVKNYHTLFADVCELTLPDSVYDAVSCRMGFMFFPDMQLAAEQMYRVLKPGGRVATSVWAAPALNNWITTIMSVIQKHVPLMPPAPTSPGMFRCAQPGLIAGIFEKAGFTNIKEEQITGPVNYESFNRYWEIMLDVGAPIVAALEHADFDTKAIIKEETKQLFRSQNEPGEAFLKYASIIISAVK